MGVENKGHPGRQFADELTRIRQRLFDEFKGEPHILARVCAALFDELQSVPGGVLAEVRAAGSPTMTVDAAGEILGCKRRRVFELLAEGALQGAPKFGRRRMVTRASVLALLAAPALPTLPAAPPRGTSEANGDAIRELLKRRRESMRSGVGRRKGGVR